LQLFSEPSVEVTQLKTAQNQWATSSARELLQLNGKVTRLTSKYPEGSEVRSMMAEKFSVPELTALRSELLQGFDSKDAAELVQMFLAGRGYGVSPEAARTAVSRVGLLGSTLEAFQRELENIALAM
jgi:hypothetical protein